MDQDPPPRGKLYESALDTLVRALDAAREIARQKGKLHERRDKL